MESTAVSVSLAGLPQMTYLVQRSFSTFELFAGKGLKIQEMSSEAVLTRYTETAVDSIKRFIKNILFSSWPPPIEPNSSINPLLIVGPVFVTDDGVTPMTHILNLAKLFGVFYCKRIFCSFVCQKQKKKSKFFFFFKKDGQQTCFNPNK